MKKISFIRLYFLVVVSFAWTTTFAQDPAATTNHATSEDSAAMNALVLYPANIRVDIFEACEYPAAIVNISTLQKKSSSDFAELVSSYSKEKQEDFWNLSRYPALVSDIVKGGKKSQDEIRAVASRYPSDVQEDALSVGKSHYDVLEKMEEMHTQMNAQFAQAISDYPPVTQDALRELIQYPEIISLLHDHLEMTVRVGDHYRRDPQGVIHRAEERNMEEVRKNAEDAEAWKKNMEENPDEANDLKSAAKDYASENGYTEDEMNVAPSPEYVNNYTCPSYSFWFGYPTWYPYSYWYPYPYWYDCGFYYDPFGHMVFIGHPSYYFTNWYFYYPEHWHRYPHLCNSYIDHYYYGVRRHVGGNDIVVRNWMRENRNYLPKDFTSNRSGRVEAIRQVGQLHIDARKEKGGRAATSVEREKYFQKNTTRYPSLNTSHAPAKDNEGRQSTISEPKPEKLPPVRIPKEAQQSREPSVAPRQQQETRPPASTNFNEINKAQEYHRNVWDKTQPISRPQSPSAPRSEPSVPRSQPSAPRPQPSSPRSQPAAPRSQPMSPPSRPMSPKGR